MKPAYVLLACRRDPCRERRAAMRRRAATQPRTMRLPIKPVAAAEGRRLDADRHGDARGGFLMGNPNAKVKLVEYGSLTCPHCARVRRERRAAADRQICEDRQGQLRIPQLRPRRLRPRPRRWSPAATARKSFFPLTRALVQGPAELGRQGPGAPPAQLQALQNLPPNQQFLEIAKLAGLQQWAAMRGVPAAKSTQCLTNEKRSTSWSR